MYQVLDKDTIKKEIIPHLSTAQRGYKTKGDMVKMVNSIFIKIAENRLRESQKA